MSLFLRALDGAETRLDPAHPGEISDVVKALDPACHHGLRLEIGALQALARPLRHAANLGGTATLHATRGSEARWLGRVRAGGEILVDGARLPPLVEVPVTWISSAIGVFLNGADWPASLPWYDERFSPLGSWRAEAFAFERLSSAGAGTAELLARLRGEISRLFRSTTPPDAVFAIVIAELRRVGHDLWNVDVGSSGEDWGSDYMRSAEGQGLFLELRWGRRLHIALQFGEARAG